MLPVEARALAGAVSDCEDPAEGKDRADRPWRIRHPEPLTVLGEKVRCLLGV